MRGVPRATIVDRVAAMLELIQLPALGHRKPAQLSGGQQQRVALARALIVEPRLLLLDEPLSNLDANLREEMRELILRVQRHFGITTLIVTHDQQDAVLLADYIALIQTGQLQQFGTPDALFYRPINEQVARFLGGVNFLPGELSQQTIRTAIGTFCSPINILSGEVMLTIRPEHIQFCEPDQAANSVSGIIERCQFIGTFYRHTVRVDRLNTPLIVHSNSLLLAGTMVTVCLPPEHIWLFEAGS
jgi:ABC-type Fe3+/spermidine/putrescine transport system ATPase subunit